MFRRWDDDERGEGVADASHLADGARQLVEAMIEPNWVAEDPEAHLLPHIRHACGHAESPLRLDGAEVEADGTFVLSLSWLGKESDRRGIRAAAVALVGEFAESALYVREHRTDGVASFDVVTGLLSTDTQFAPHGHTLRLSIRPAQ